MDRLTRAKESGDQQEQADAVRNVQAVYKKNGANPLLSIGLIFIQMHVSSSPRPLLVSFSNWFYFCCGLHALRLYACASAPLRLRVCVRASVRPSVRAFSCPLPPPHPSYQNLLPHPLSHPHPLLSYLSLPPRVAACALPPNTPIQACVYLVLLFHPASGRGRSHKCVAAGDDEGGLGR